jgi:hypothetical protein
MVCDLHSAEGSFLNEFSRLQKSWRLRENLAPCYKWPFFKKLASGAVTRDRGSGSMVS